MSLISVNNLTFGYDGSLKNIFENVSFNIDTDWKLGLIGRNGKGKTTFLKLLLGKYEYQGAISKNVEFDYFPFEVKNKERMAIEIVNEIAPNVEDWEIIRELNLLNTDTEVLYRSFNLLSGGEQIKILLISLFLKGNNFLLIDEPTNHLDIETRNNLVNYLEKKKGFILVSHDRNFLDKVVNHIISINNTNIEIQQGNFSSWKENKNRQDNFEKIQNERLQKDINRLEIASKNCAKWSNEAEKTKNKKYNSETTIDKGYIGHKADKMMKKSKVMEQRIEKAIIPISKRNEPLISITKDVVRTSAFLYVESIPNLSVASKTLSKRIGIRSDAVDEIKSTVPYSDVDKTAVYNGTNKKDRILEPKLPNVNKPIFLINVLFFLFIQSPSTLYHQLLLYQHHPLHK